MTHTTIAPDEISFDPRLWLASVRTLGGAVQPCHAGLEVHWPIYGRSQDEQQAMSSLMQQVRDRGGRTEAVLAALAT